MRCDAAAVERGVRRIVSQVFAIGEAPTGSRDPFALRRAALGVIRIILENRLRLSLGDLRPAHGVEQ